ncbi:MAG: hypothetical protein HBSAPP03_21010 [Phycisphaerae bacterium]|nr:MAG: hypothetical protein HBSAPP03_21010 [Phycisphaerae bacterium]
MAIKNLTDEQVRTWTIEQKDRWWLENVWRGDMPQLTLRSAFTGFMLGGILSATNLYVGARTGWTLGVGITSVILAFAMFRIMSRLGAKDMTILENNCSQSIATAAGYMTGPLISGIAAYMWVTNQSIPWWQLMGFMVVLSFLGVLVAFPMKRRFINDEQQPFPEGRAAGVVLDTLYTSSAAVGVFKAKALAWAAGVAGVVTFLAGENYQKLIQERWLGFKQNIHIPHNLDAWYYWMVGKGWVPVPKLAGVDVRQLALTPGMDLAMFGAGGLMGIRSATSLLIGMALNFIIIVPIMIHYGELAPASGSIEAGDAKFGRAYILNNWALWWGIAMMVVASMTALFAKPEVLVRAFRGLLGKKRAAEDVLKHIELPLSWSAIGVPIVGVCGAWMAHEWFGVSWIFGLTAIAMVIALTLIAASSTALTGTTPTGSLSKIPQFTYGALDPGHAPTNLMTGVMCVEVASNASNLLMDIKPGYMLGAKPRQQAMGHTIGIIAGALASVPLFFGLFMSDFDAGKAEEARNRSALTETATAPVRESVREVRVGLAQGDVPVNTLERLIDEADKAAAAAILSAGVRAELATQAEARAEAAQTARDAASAAFEAGQDSKDAGRLRGQAELAAAAFIAAKAEATQDRRAATTAHAEAEKARAAVEAARASLANREIAAAREAISNAATHARAAATHAQKENLYYQTVMAPEGGSFSFPSAVQWKGVSQLVTSIFGEESDQSLMKPSIVWSMIIASLVALVFEVLRIVTKGKFPLVPLAIGLGVVVPPESSMAMFAGAAFFWIMHRVYHARKESTGHRLWIDTHEPICAGIIAGAAILGIGDALIKAFLLK